MEQLIESQFKLFALDSHLERSLQLKDHDSRLEFLFDDLQAHLPNYFAILNSPDVRIPLPCNQRFRLSSARILRGSVLALVREITNHAHAGGKGIEKGVTPAGGEKRSRFLIDELVGLREKVRVLPARRRREFLHGDGKADFDTVLLLLKRERLEQGELFRNVLLGKFPIAQDILHRQNRYAQKKQILEHAHLRPRGEPSQRAGGERNATQEWRAGRSCRRISFA